MKKNIKYIKRIGIFVLALVVAACTEFKEFESTTYGPGPSVTLTEFSVEDSTFTVSVSSSADGHASVILLPGSGNDVPEDPEDLVTGNIEAMDYQSKSVKADVATKFTFSGLVQNANFEVMAAANNGDGKVSEVVALAVGTDDTHAPTLVETTPEVGYDPVLTLDGTVVLVFDEAVQYDDTKEMTFSSFFDGVDMLAGEVDVDFNVVTITPADSIRNREYLWLSYPEGTFTDYAGNLAPEVVTGFNDAGDGFEGLYWRAEEAMFEAVSVLPEEGTLEPTAFDIVVTFPQAVDAQFVKSGDITISYDDGMNVLTKSVLAAEVSSEGNDLTVKQSRTPLPGETVTINIPEGTLSIGIGSSLEVVNPNAAFTASWDALHPLQSWLGDYSVDAQSYGDTANWDESWAITIGSYADDFSMLAITIDAGNGGGVPFLAAFDTIANTITIAPGTNAGNLYVHSSGANYGRMLLYLSDYFTYIDDVNDIVGTLGDDGSINIDYLGLYAADQGWLWDAFNTTWTKSATKSAVSRRSIHSSKTSR